MTGQKSGAPEGAEGAALITIPQAAALLMITEQWVRDLCRKGFIPRPERGKVPLVGAVRGYIRYLKDEDRRASKTAAASAVQQARAKEIEMRIAREAGELIEMPSIEAVFADCMKIFREELSIVGDGLAVGGKVGRLVKDAAERAESRFEQSLDRLRR